MSDIIKSIAITPLRWTLLREKLISEHGRTTIIISWKLKECLGCTVRAHYDQGRSSIYLDFYSESMKTMFILKYSEFLTDFPKEDVRIVW